MHVIKNSPLQDKFQAAIKNYNILEIKEYLANGINANTLIIDNQITLPALHYVILHCPNHSITEQIVDSLLSHSACPDILTPLEETALHLAVKKNLSTIVKRFIEANALLNVLDQQGNTPLHLAVQAKSKDIIQQLLQAGANPSLQNIDRKSPIELTDDASIKSIFQGVFPHMPWVLSPLENSHSLIHWVNQKDQKAVQVAKQLVEQFKDYKTYIAPLLTEILPFERCEEQEILTSLLNAYFHQFADNKSPANLPLLSYTFTRFSSRSFMTLQKNKYDFVQLYTEGFLKICDQFSGFKFKLNEAKGLQEFHLLTVLNFILTVLSIFKVKKPSPQLEEKLINTLRYLSNLKVSIGDSGGPDFAFQIHYAIELLKAFESKKKLFKDLRSLGQHFAAASAGLVAGVTGVAGTLLTLGVGAPVTITLTIAGGALAGWEFIKVGNDIKQIVKDIGRMSWYEAYNHIIVGLFLAYHSNKKSDWKAISEAISHTKKDLNYATIPVVQMLSLSLQKNKSYVLPLLVELYDYHFNRKAKQGDPLNEHDHIVTKITVMIDALANDGLLKEADFQQFLNATSFKNYTLAQLKQLTANAVQLVEMNRQVVQRNENLFRLYETHKNDCLLEAAEKVDKKQYASYQFFTRTRLRDLGQLNDFIPLRCKEKDNPPDDAVKAIHQFLNSSSKVMVVTGLTPQDRRLFQKVVTLRLWRLYEEGKPIPISLHKLSALTKLALNEIEYAKDYDNFIMDYSENPFVFLVMDPNIDNTIPIREIFYRFPHAKLLIFCQRLSDEIKEYFIHPLQTACQTVELMSLSPSQQESLFHRSILSTHQTVEQYNRIVKNHSKKDLLEALLAYPYFLSQFSRHSTHPEEVNRLIQEYTQFTRSNQAAFRSNVTAVVDHYQETAAKYTELRTKMRDHHQVALTGMAGSGKTQLATRYANHCLKHYPSWKVWKIVADTTENLFRGYRALADQLMIDTNIADLSLLCQKVQESLEKNDEGFLLFFDNVEKWDLIQPFLPKRLTDQRRVIITTQDAKLLPQTEQLLSVEGFTREEAENFLLEGKILSEAERKETMALAEEFSFLPLGLAAAKLYVKENKLTYTYYRRELLTKEKAQLEIKQDELMAKYYLDKKEGYRTQWAALRLVVDKLKQNYPIARQVLEYSIFFHPDNIPYFLWEATSSVGKVFFNECLLQLQKYSLLKVDLTEVNDFRLYSIHRQIQKVLRELISAENKHLYLKKVTKIISSHFTKDTASPENTKKNTFLLPHIEAALRGPLTASLIQSKEEGVQPLLNIIPHWGQEPNLSSHQLSIAYLLNVMAYFATQNGRASLDQAEQFSFIVKQMVEQLAAYKKEVKGLALKLSQACQQLDDMISNDLKSALSDLYEALESYPKGIQIHGRKLPLLPILYISILYTLGRMYFYTDNHASKEEMRGYLLLSYYLSKRFKAKRQQALFYEILAERTGVLYFDLENEKNTALIQRAVARYLDLLQIEGHYITEEGEKSAITFTRSKQQLQLPGIPSHTLSLTDNPRHNILCYRQLIKGYGLLKQFKEASIFVKELEDWVKAEEKKENKNERLADYLNTLGEFYRLPENYLHDLNRSEAHFLKACQLEEAKNKGEGKKDFPLADAYKGLALIYLEKKIENKALDFINKALQVREAMHGKSSAHSKLQEIKRLHSTISAKAEASKATSKIEALPHPLTTPNPAGLGSALKAVSSSSSPPIQKATTNTSSASNASEQPFHNEKPQL